MATILILSGLSGTGKTTLAGEILRSEARAQMIPSLTTRPARDTDLPGEYEYGDGAWFEYCKRDGLFLWSVTRGNTRYGTLRSSVRQICESDDRIGIMILVPSAVQKLARFMEGQYDQVKLVPIFLTPPSADILHARLIARGTKPAEIKKRAKLESNWVAQAQNSPVPFSFISAGNDLSELPAAVSAVLAKLG